MVSVPAGRDAPSVQVTLYEPGAAPPMTAPRPEPAMPSSKLFSGVNPAVDVVPVSWV